MTWQAVSDRVVEIRARWRGAPANLGPYSRSRRSLDLLRHARADVAALLAEVDSTQGDPCAELIVEMTRLGACDIAVRPVRALAGTRGWYQVTWTSWGAVCAVEAWTPVAALRLAVRRLSAAPVGDSDRLEGVS